jgi:hypothetical protein
VIKGRLPTRQVRITLRNLLTNAPCLSSAMVMRSGLLASLADPRAQPGAADFDQPSRNLRPPKSRSSSFPHFFDILCKFLGDSLAPF